MKIFLKITITAFLYIFSFIGLYSFDFTEPDDLYMQGKYEEGLKILLEKYSPDKPDPALIWRKSRMIYEIADAMPEKHKKEKIGKNSQKE